ncbi:ArsR family transcriptional regulator [Patescibacteria group bacterium]|nr:ArsR family transcriptional regulator [Patescibacteria group bacterium]
MTNEQLTILFGSKTRVKLLKHFLKDPGQKYFVRELTRLLADHINAIRHELGNLENAGLVTKKKSQGKLYYRLDQEAHGINELKLLFTERPKAAQVEEVDQRQMYSVRPGQPAPIPNLGDVKLLVQNGKFVSSKEAPADLLVVGDIEEDLLTEYLKGLEKKHGEVRYSLMSETEFAYRSQLFDRFLTLMLAEPKKVIINNLPDRQLVKG